MSQTIQEAAEKYYTNCNWRERAAKQWLQANDERLKLMAQDVPEGKRIRFVPYRMTPANG